MRMRNAPNGETLPHLLRRALCPQKQILTDLNRSPVFGHRGGAG